MRAMASVVGSARISIIVFSMCGINCDMHSNGRIVSIGTEMIGIIGMRGAGVVHTIMMTTTTTIECTSRPTLRVSPAHPAFELDQMQGSRGSIT